MRERASIALAGTALALCAFGMLGPLSAISVAILLLCFAGLLNLRALLRNSWQVRPLWFAIPFAIIAISVFVNWGIHRDHDSYLMAMMLVVMLLCYLLGTVFGRKILWAFLPAAAVQAVAIIVQYATDPHRYLSGLTYYAHIHVPLMLLAALFAPRRWRPLLLGIALAVSILSGSEEWLPGIVAIALIMLLTMDFNRRVLLTAAPVAVVLLVVICTGTGSILYPKLTQERFSSADEVLKMRDEVYAEAYWEWGESPLTMAFGTGPDYALGGGSIHNAPLKVTHDLGLWAGLAWLGMTFWLSVRSRYRYAFAIIFALSLIDNYFWTYLFPWYFCLLGIAAVDRARDDRIFGHPDPEPVPVHAASHWTQLKEEI